MMKNNPSTKNILDTIVEQKKREITHLPEGPVSVSQWQSALTHRCATRDFIGALRNPVKGDVGLIAEIKKASPSAGIIRADFDPVAIAKSYESSGADCLSVLTDTEFFQGSLHYLRAIREEVALPLLRKDFIIDERQILESIEWGADAILLIAAILDDTQLRDFHQLASESGLAVLVEVHNECELDRALNLDIRLLGINNRNLKDFTVNLETTERLAARALKSRSESDLLIVAESGIHQREDVLRLKTSGAKAILVGESLMKHKDIPLQVSKLLGLENP